MEEFYWYIYKGNKRPEIWEVCIGFNFVGTIEMVPDEEFDKLSLSYIGKMTQKEFEVYNRMGYYIR